MDTTILEELGLSKGEVTVYLTLLELGPTKVGRVIERSGMASSAVHNSINTLSDKGFVSHIKKGKIKWYKAVAPRYLIDFIEDKKRRVLSILPQLEVQQQLAQEKQEAEVFEGKKGILTMLNLLIEHVHKGDDYVFFAVRAKEYDKELREFFTPYDLKRKEKGLIIKGLAPPECKHIFMNRKFVKMKYPHFPIPTSISICNDHIAFFSWGEKPIGYLITSAQIAEMYREYFNKIWKKV